TIAPSRSSDRLKPILNGTSSAIIAPTSHRPRVPRPASPDWVARQAFQTSLSMVTSSGGKKKASPNPGNRPEGTGLLRSHYLGHPVFAPVPQSVLQLLAALRFGLAGAANFRRERLQVRNVWHQGSESITDTCTNRIHSFIAPTERE